MRLWLLTIILIMAVGVCYGMNSKDKVKAFDNDGNVINVIESYDENTGLLEVITNESINNAVVNIPARKIKGVSSYRLLVDGRPEKPYCKVKTEYNTTKVQDCDTKKDPLCLFPKEKEKIVKVKEKEECYYDLKLENNTWTFNVEHFTTYQVENTGQFNCLSACLEWINNTADTCVLGAGYWDVRDCTTNITGLRIAGDRWIYNKLWNNSPNATSTTGDMLIGADMYTSAGIQRAVFKINDTTLENKVLNGTITTSKMYFQAGTKRDLDAENYFSLYLINESNVWNNKNTSWNWLNQTTPWTGEKGCNQAGVDYNPENYSINFLSGNATGKYYGITFPSKWLIGWINKTIRNNGIFFKEEGDTDSYRRYVMWGGFDGYYPPYLELDVENVEIMARQEYKVLGTAIQIGSQDVTLNLSGVRLEGNNNNYGVYYYRQGGNVTVMNADLNNFSTCLMIDTYFDTKCDTTTTSSKTENCGNAFYGCQNTNWNNHTNGGTSYTEYSVAGIGYHHDIRVTGLTGDSYLGIDQNQNDVFERIYVTSYGKTSKTAWISGGSNVTFKDSTITGDYTNRGLEVLQTQAKIINNTITNFTTCIYADTQPTYMQIENNTLEDCGNSTTSSGFFIDSNPRNYGGTDYAYTGMFVHKGTGTLLNVPTNNVNVGAYFDGTQDGTLCLHNIAGGLVQTTIIDTNADSCATLTAVLNAIYPGTTLDYYEDDVYQNNGAGNDYTEVFSASTTTVTGYSEPDLSYDTTETQNNYALEIRTDYNTIKGNTFNNNTNAPTYYSLYMSSETDYNNISYNNFYYAGVDDQTGDNSYCVEEEGNYYEESLTPISGDCGSGNITDLIFTQTYTNNTIRIIFTNQSSLNKSLTYYLEYDGRTIKSGDTVILPSNETNITLIPFDGRFNGTHFSTQTEDHYSAWNFAVALIIMSCFFILGFLSMEVTGGKWKEQEK